VIVKRKVTIEADEFKRVFRKAALELPVWDGVDYIYGGG